MSFFSAPPHEFLLSLLFFCQYFSLLCLSFSIQPQAMTGFRCFLLSSGFLLLLRIFIFVISVLFAFRSSLSAFFSSSAFSSSFISSIASSLIFSFSHFSHVNRVSIGRSSRYRLLYWASSFPDSIDFLHYWYLAISFRDWFSAISFHSIRRISPPGPRHFHSYRAVFSSACCQPPEFRISAFTAFFAVAFCASSSFHIFFFMPFCRAFFVFLYI